MAHRHKTPTVVIQPITPDDLARLEQWYTLRNPELVISFLEDHPFLLSLLFEAPPYIRKSFPDEPLSLEVTFDPEEAALTHLTVYIATAGDRDIDEVLDKLDRFGEEWWLGVIGQTDMKLNFAVESC